MQPRVTPTPLPPDDRISVAELREIGLFGALSDDALGHLSANLKILHRGSDEVIFAEGDRAREFYVVLRGEVEVFKVLKRGAEARLATLSPGHWFGEMSVLDVQPRSASVRALVPCTLLLVTAHDLDSLYRRDLKSYTLLVLNIARELARRLRLVDALVADFIGSVRDQHIGYG
ncbi:MAG TPA: cyclic nucleotide-binding domain-containing protein [Polyangiaceae bacterium]|nr:cyclic nucleotide-binding domain-containing protein [Polyangiaceae bacterium]